MLRRRTLRASAPHAIWMFGAAFTLAACQGGAPADKPAATASGEEAPTAAAAPTPPAGAGPSIATYNGKAFTLGDYREALGSLNARARKALDESTDRRRQFVENHILSQLIYEEGAKRGLDADPEIQRRLDELKRHLVVQQVMEEQQNATITDDDVKAYYDANQQEFSTEKVKASHILVDTEELARELHAKVVADPSQFGALAAEHSKDLSNAKRGGDLGTFGRGRMVKEFEDAAFGLAADGDISEPVKTRFGWHIIQRTGREDGSVQGFEQVKSQIKVKMVSEARRERTAGFLEKLKEKSSLSIDEAALAAAMSAEPGTVVEDDEDEHAGHGH
jgi:peptidyl-prolyl cis-trans isomerase C